MAMSIGNIFRDFNPRSREGSDCFCNTGYLYQPDFNPRSREGSDRQCKQCETRYQYFNPRSREGSDLARQQRKLSTT